MTKIKMKQTETGKPQCMGKWEITKMIEWDDDYVNEEDKAFIETEKSGLVEFHFGYVQCSMSGDFKKSEGESLYDFTFDGNDECEPTTGDGWMKINPEGTAEGEIRFHMGDCSKFWARRKK